MGGGGRCLISGLDIFDSKRQEDMGFSCRFVEVPSVERHEYDVLSIDHQNGDVIASSNSCRLPTVFRLPTFVGLDAADDRRVTDGISAADRAGQNLKIVVLTGCGCTRIIDW